jgi:hypothetical protein
MVRTFCRGFAQAIFRRSGLRPLKAEKRPARQADDHGDRFNVNGA